MNINQELAKAYARQMNKGVGNVPEWTTRDEVAFLFVLGTGDRSGMGLGPYPTRRELLRRYLHAAQQRVEWGDIDRDVCITIAGTFLLAEEQGRQQ
jgi:hypothetical protein